MCANDAAIPVLGVVCDAVIRIKCDVWTRIRMDIMYGDARATLFGTVGSAVFWMT